jgi:hypothetical protein
MDLYLDVLSFKAGLEYRTVYLLDTKTSGVLRIFKFE